MALITNITAVATWFWALSALLPLLVGGGLLKCFKDWAYSEKEFREQISQAKCSIAEKLAQDHRDLIDATNRLSARRDAPDPVSQYSNRLQHAMSRLLRVEVIRLESEGAYGALVTTVLISVVLLVVGIFVIAFQLSEFCIYIIFAVIIVLTIQVALFRWTRHLTKHLDRELEEPS